MPPRHAVYTLPAEILEELNARLVGSGFGNYRGLSAWLKEQGYNISKSALHNYGQEFEIEFNSAMADSRKSQELARAAVAQRDDSGAALLEATSDVAQDILLKLMIALRKADHEPDKAAKLVSLAVRSLADLGRMTLDQRKWLDQVRKQAAEEAGQIVEQAAKKAGVSAEGVSAIRAAILSEMA